MSVIKSFPDRYISKLAAIIMNDQEIAKFLYYNNVMDKDIYSLPDVKSPVSKLLDKKVFMNRRVESLFLKSDISIFINLYSDEPKNMNGRKSRFYDTLKVEIGVICHNDCRKTLNGARESVVFNRLEEIVRTNEELDGVKKPKIGGAVQSYNIPYDYNAYIFSITVDYFSTM